MKRVLVVIALVVGSTVSLHAQDTPNRNVRQGFWFSGGLGWGSVGVDCNQCSNSRIGGPSGYIRLGGTLGNGRWLLGGELNGWGKSENGVDETIGFASFIATFYPSRTGAFFLKLGVGGMAYEANDGIDRLEATAPSAIFGLGYDIRVGRNVSLTPYANSMASSSVDFSLNGTQIGSAALSLNLAQIGLAVTIH